MEKLSSNSLYLKGQRCRSDGHTSYKFDKLTFLDNKLKSSASGFIQLEKRFGYFKSGDKYNVGEPLIVFDVYSILCKNDMSQTIHTLPQKN
jgi:hypothetical protein